MKKKIAIIGHFGGDKDFFDGQTVKTKILFDELSKAIDWEIKKVDTYLNKTNKIKLLFVTFKCLFSCKKIIILVSGNGMKLFFPLLFFFAKFFHKDIYHDVIGGNLDKNVNKNPKYIKYLNSFKYNWVETENLKTRLQNEGVTNCEVIPNFKRLKTVELSDSSFEFDEPYRFCTFSRVIKEKGISDAVIAVDNINKQHKRIICKLDIYGVIDENYNEEFFDLLKGKEHYVKYCGIVPYDESVETLKSYYGLLFPTFWKGEGFPGTVVDAFSAGLPVIATDWNCNKEIITDLVDGIIYPSDTVKTLRDAIEWSVENKTLFLAMKEKCLEKARKYQPDEYIKTIIERIGLNC